MKSVRAPAMALVACALLFACDPLPTALPLASEVSGDTLRASVTDSLGIHGFRQHSEKSTTNPSSQASHFVIELGKTFSNYAVAW